MHPKAPVSGYARLEGDRLIIKKKLKKLQAGEPVFKVTVYRVQFIAIHPDIGRPPTWEIQKLTEDGTPFEGVVYHIHQDEFGRWNCDCASYNFVKHKHPLGCKHVRACAAVGLLEVEV